MFTKFINFVPIYLKIGSHIDWTYTMYLAKKCIDQNSVTCVSMASGVWTKGYIIDLIPNCMPTLETADSGIFRDSSYHTSVGCIEIQSKDSCFAFHFYTGETDNDLYQTTLQALLNHLLRHAGGRFLLSPRFYTGTLLHRYPCIHILHPFLGLQHFRNTCMSTFLHQML